MQGSFYFFGVVVVVVFLTQRIQGSLNPDKQFVNVVADLRQYRLIKLLKMTLSGK